MIRSKAQEISKDSALHADDCFFLEPEQYHLKLPEGEGQPPQPLLGSQLRLNVLCLLPHQVYMWHLDGHYDDVQ